MIKEQEIIKKAWEKYIATDTPIPTKIEGVRDEIVASWKRSKQSVDPFQTNLTLLPKNHLEKKISENALLIKIAYPYLLEFYKNLQSTDYQIILADKQGNQLKRIADNQKQDQLAQEKQLFDGCIYAEEVVGTNGIGMCLTLKRPFMVVGYEHYLEMYHNVVCYCSPIYDHLQQLVGCILITGPIASLNPMIMGMLSAAVAGIKKEMELTSMNHLLNSTMESLNSAILVLDYEKKIIHFNKKVCNVLQLTQEELKNKMIHEILDIHSLPEALKSFKTNFENIECTIRNKNNVLIDVSLTIRPQSLDSTLILVELQSEVHQLANQLAGAKAIYTFDDIHGSSTIIQNLKLIGEVIAKSNQPALIFGESGTGKDMVAQAIHNASVISEGPFISVNCGIIQKTYLEKELWGNHDDLINHKPGKIELAQGGTLFLIEISNLPMEVQEKLYNFLKTYELTDPLTNYKKKVKVRILASTSKNLFSLVEEGMFRQDLYYLLNSLQLMIPPLRQRKEDILLLSNLYIKQYSQVLGIQEPRLNNESMNALLHYDWPQNLRQLESVIDCAVNACNGKEIGLSSLPLDIVNDYYEDKNATFFYATNRLEETSSSLHPKAQEYNQILYAIKSSKGNVKLAAESLHMSLSTLYRKLNKYHIYPKDFEEGRMK